MSRVTFLPERRFSMKIILHRVRRKTPWLYKVVLRLRFLLFSKQCGSDSDSSVVYTDGSWVHRKETRDLKNIVKSLRGEPTTFDCLQVGIGNSYFYKELKDKFSSFCGVTIVQGEADLAKSIRSEDAQYTVLVTNKYSDFFSQLAGDYDLIVDNDINGYACCKRHFFRLLDSYHSKLRSGGRLIIGVEGLEYFDTGFGLTVKKFLSIIDLEKFKFSVGDGFYVLTKIGN